MSSPPTLLADPITDHREFVAFFAGGCKPKEAWRIGTEHEKFAYGTADYRSLPYEGPQGIRVILELLHRRFGWQKVMEGDNVIALSHDGCSITLEPGGQIELSGAPVQTLHDTCDEVTRHLTEMKEVCGELDVGLLGMGFQPKWPRDAIPWMPKGRYKGMKAYMPTRGDLGLDMMTRTCTIQVNLDFESEADMVRKFRVSLALQPIATALFANSPFVEGRPVGYQSYRSHVWTRTDPDRCGMLDFVFEPGFGFERYVDYLLDVPMYFVYRDGRYLDAAGQSFRDFLAGRLPALPDALPTLSDFRDHLTTVFPEVRLKRYLEMRGTDGGPWRRICALSAVWTGLLYDGTALDAAWDLIKDWSVEEIHQLQRDVPVHGVRAIFRGRPVKDWAVRVLDIASAGLKVRNRLDAYGEDEVHFLNSLWMIAESGRSPADEILEKFETEWQGRVEPLFTDYAY